MLIIIIKIKIQMKLTNKWIKKMLEKKVQRKNKEISLEIKEEILIHNKIGGKLDMVILVKRNEIKNFKLRITEKIRTKIFFLE